MRRVVRLTGLVVLAAVVFVGVGTSIADEGMWTFDNPPVASLKGRYGFEPTAEWLERLRLASVRFEGASGAFVSSEGLVLTNHHVGRGQIQKLSTRERDYLEHGFVARTRAEELKCPDLELSVLVSMEEVTARVQGAVRPGMSEAEALAARKAEIARIEKDSLDRTGLRSEVVSLYHGGEYWLYRYRTYRDVRLVFAPEHQAAFFGGDPDNFTYPRYDLDFALFRVYENGQPLKTPHYLKVNPKGPAEGELVFISGHPGRTSRLFTLRQLEFLRDHWYPLVLRVYERRLKVLREYAAQGPDQAREASNLVFGLENAVKAFTGELAGLRNPAILARKQREEEEFRRRVASRPEWQRLYGDAWDEIARAMDRQIEMFPRLWHRSLAPTFSRLPTLALQIVRYVTEVTKPDAERLDGFHDAQLDALRLQLFSPAPVYPALNEVLMADAWQEALEALGGDDPFVKAVLDGRSPPEAARRWLSGTRLGDPAVRKALIEGGADAVAQSTDPLIVLARRLDPLLREMTRWRETNVDSVTTAAGEKIGRARFAVYGKTVSPDATGTLRLAFGVVKGYPMNGTQAPYKTTLFGLFDRAYSFDLKPPYHLPDRFVRARDRLDLATPVNFVSTADIIGGNSGSPVVNRRGELVGLIFDGNIEQLVANFVYDDERGRAVAVHPAFILEALRKLYDAAHLADELEGR
jgi:hypothetical protein